mmetsp:Transcript_60831/g.162712  ORF Transcript_60831/g.162712 Transcript_60831/m.162712 type:complete len:219 (-) Transcript_60831:331-987(-)
MIFGFGNPTRCPRPPKKSSTPPALAVNVLNLAAPPSPSSRARRSSSTPYVARSSATRSFITAHARTIAAKHTASTSPSDSRDTLLITSSSPPTKKDSASAYGRQSSSLTAHDSTPLVRPIPRMNSSRSTPPSPSPSIDRNSASRSSSLSTSRFPSDAMAALSSARPSLPSGLCAACWSKHWRRVSGLRVPSRPWTWLRRRWRSSALLSHSAASPLSSV